MALTETLDLDIRAAQNQLSRLNAQLDQLAQPLNIPVNISGEQAADSLRRDLNQADNAVESLNTELRETDRELDQIRGSARGASDAVLRVGTGGASAFSNLRGSILGVGAALVAIQGVRLLGGGAAAAIKEASSLEEAISKTNVVFGQFSDEVQVFAKAGPEALGLSNRAALQATSTFGNLFVALGLSQQAASDLSPDIVQLASDLASFNDIDVAEAIEKLRAGLVGEAEPLRALGVNLTAALVEAKALELGLVDASGAVTEAGKVQARYALILEQTTTAQGDYARTADGIANTQRSLQAAIQDLSAEFGQALIPAYRALLELAPTVLEAIRDLEPVVARLAQGFADGVPAIESFVDAIQILTTVPTVLGAFKEGSDALRDFGQGLTLLAVPGGFRAGLNQIRQGVFSIGEAVDNVNVEILRNDLINAVQAGVAPVNALADAVARLGGAGLDPAELNAEAAALAAIAGVDFTGAVAAADILREQGKNAGLSTPQIQAMTRALLAVHTVGSRFDADDIGLPPPPPIAPDILQQVDALDQLEAAAALTGGSIASLITDYDNLPPALQRAVDALSGSTVEYLEQVDAIDALRDEIGVLPGAMSAAQEALRDEEGQIIEDLDTFFEQFRTTMAEQEQFDLDLAILRIRGQGALADQFEEAGVEAGQALADAVADPVKAGLFNAELLGLVRDAGEGIAAEIEASIAGMPVTQGLIDSIVTAATQADSPEVRTALLNLAEALQLEIPVIFGPLPNIPAFSGEQRREFHGTEGLQTPLQITNNFFDTPAPTTDTVRINQSLTQIRGTS